MDSFSSVWLNSAWQDRPDSVQDSVFMGLNNLVVNSSLAIPFAVALGSLVFQLIHFSVSTTTSHLKSKPGPINLSVADVDDLDDITLDSNPSRPRVDQFDQSPEAQEPGSLAVNPYSVARLIGIFTLLVLSTISSFRACQHRRCVVESPEKYTILTYLYCTILAAASLKIGKWQIIATRHNITVLLTLFSIYAYRDIWPLATYTMSPMDLDKGPLLWAEVALLSITAIIVPICAPRHHLSSISQQRISLFAYMTNQNFDDAKLDQVVPLAKGDQAKYLLEKTIPHWNKVVKKKDDSLFDALLRVFWKEYTITALALVVQVSLSFIYPTGIYHLLNYLEVDGVDAVMRPWFWILCIAGGPLLQSIFERFSHSLATQTDARFRAVAYHFIFERSLAMKLPSPQPSPNPSSDDQQPTPQPTPRSRPASTTDASAKEVDVEYTVETVKSLLEKDMSLYEGKNLLDQFVKLPLQFLLCSVFIGWALGFGVMTWAETMLINSLGFVIFIMKRLNPIAMASQKLSQSRVKGVAEVLGILKTVKLLGWEYGMAKKIEDTRHSELSLQRKVKLYATAHAIWLSTLPTLVMLLAYHFKAGAKKFPPSLIFSSMIIFLRLGDVLKQFVALSHKFLAGAAAWSHIDKFLRKTVSLESTTTSVAATRDIPVGTESLGFGDISFAWTSAQSNLSSHRPYKLLIEGELLFKPNCVNIITGPKKSGKTSLLLALLGEMHTLESDVQGWVNLPQHGGVAYAAQNPWIYNGSIRENILCGTPYDETRYLEVISQCGLQKYLKTLANGDDTKVEKNGLKIGQGEKKQIGLARAIYSRARIILLDDIFGNLDKDKSVSIVNDCLGGSLVEGRTILLATEDLNLVVSIAKFVVSIAHDGQVKETSFEEYVAPRSVEPARPAIDQCIKAEIYISEDEIEPSYPWDALRWYFTGIGGKSFPSRLLPYLWSIAAMSATFLNYALMWVIGCWGSAEELGGLSKSNFTIISWLVFFTMVIFNIASTSFYIFSNIRLLQNTHTAVMDSIIGGSFRWLKESPIDAILSNYAKDVSTVDFTFFRDFYILITVSVGIITSLSIFSSLVANSLVPCLVVIATGVYIGRLNSRISYSIERRKNDARSALSSLHDNAISHLVSIRVYGAEPQCKSVSFERVDRSTQLARLQADANSFVAYMVYGCSMRVVEIGFVIIVVERFVPLIASWSKAVLQFNKEARSLSRLQKHLNIEQAPKAVETSNDPPVWATSGNLVVENLSARYSKTESIVLHDISFQINPGEQVQMVGRKGSGKSSLILALLLCIETEGEVYLDGLPTKTLHFGMLRSRIAVIPEEPDKLDGALRRNLDPFQQFDDATLNDALRASGFFSLQQELGRGDVTLDTDVTDAQGCYMLHDQWQFIVLVRAIVHDCKIVIFKQRASESAGEPRVDAAIQKALKLKLGANVTVIFVAQPRCSQVVMDADRVMVLDEGRLVEFDTPKSLLDNPNSLFNVLLNEGGDPYHNFHANHNFLID